MSNAVRLRMAALCAAFSLLPALAAAQDTTRVRADSARPAADTMRHDTIQVPAIRTPPPLPPAWRFQLDFGFQDMAGNRDLTVANAAFVVERRRQDRFILNLKLEGRYGRSNGLESVNYQLGRLRFDWKPKAPISPFIGLDVARDIIRKMALRVQLGTGANFNIDTRDDRRTFLSFGFVEDHQEYTDTTSAATDARWMLRAATVRLIGQTTRFEAIARYQPSVNDRSDYLIAAEASVRVSFTRRMGLMTKFEFIRDSKPAGGVETDDRSLTAALSFAW